MKPRIVEYDAKSPRPDRAVGDAPGIGRVAKVTDVESSSKASGRRRRVEGQSQGEQVDRLIRSLTLTAISVAVVMLLIFIVVWVKRSLTPDEQADDAVRVDRHRVVDAAPRPAVLDEREALELMRRGLAVRFVARVGEYFKLGATSRADDVVAFLEGMESKDGLVSGLDYQPPILVDSQTVGCVEVLTCSGERTTKRLALLVHDAEHGWRIDFDAFARLAEPSWQSLLDASASEGIVRVHVAGVSIEESAATECWTLESPDVEVALHGYCQPGSPQSRAMHAVMDQDAPSRQRVTLVVRPLKERGRSDFGIQRVISSDWVMGRQSFDEQFRGSLDP